MKVDVGRLVGAIPDAIALARWVIEAIPPRDLEARLDRIHLVRARLLSRPRPPRRRLTTLAVRERRILRRLGRPVPPLELP